VSGINSLRVHATFGDHLFSIPFHELDDMTFKVSANSCAFKGPNAWWKEPAFQLKVDELKNEFQKLRDSPLVEKLSRYLKEADNSILHCYSIERSYRALNDGHHSHERALYSTPSGFRILHYSSEALFHPNSLGYKDRGRGLHQPMFNYVLEGHLGDFDAQR
jgi:hypothetical protein